MMYDKMSYNCLNFFVHSKFIFPMARVYPETNQMYMEDLLHETGWGLYYNIILGITSACAFCQGISSLCLALTLPLATCGSFVTESTILTTNMCFYFGKAIGGFFLNSISDQMGRLWLIPNSLIVIFASTFIGAFSQGSTTISIAAFILGSGLEANTRSTKIHLAEILPKRWRGFFLTLPNIFWTLGYVSIIAFSWCLSKHVSILHTTKKLDMKLTAWRLILASIGGFNITVACISALLQPSPRYLLYQKQNGAAIAALKQIYAVNRSKYGETWPFKVEEVDGIISDFKINDERVPISCTEHVQLMTKKMLKTTCLLFKRKFIATTVVLVLIKAVMFTGIFPVHLILAKILILKNNNNSINGSNTLYFFESDKEISWCLNKIEDTMLIIFGLLVISIVIGQIITLITIDTLGRKLLIGFGLTLCAVSSFGLAFGGEIAEIKFILKSAFASVFLVGYTVVEETINVIIVEAYPTAMRGTAAGVTNFYSNFIFCIMYPLLSIPQDLLFIIAGIVMCCAIVIAYFVPELANRPMQE